MLTHPVEMPGRGGYYSSIFVRRGCVEKRRKDIFLEPVVKTCQKGGILLDRVIV